MKTPKKAKCNIHSLSFCNTKHNAEQCNDCILVKHSPKRYIFKNGYKLKCCPHCGEYKRLEEFKPNSRGYTSWCIDCHRTYTRMYHQINSKTFIVSYKTTKNKEFIQLESLTKTIKFVRQYLENDNSYVEIKRIK